MNCPSCKSHDVGQIRFPAIRDGLNFHYCRKCEHRWWEGAGQVVALREVLDAASTFARAS